jgi:lipopolysaccharide/colanic/teichoic acid biosynthesis glycosyltransferase
MTFINSLVGRVLAGVGKSAQSRSRHVHDGLLPVNRLIFFLERARFQSNRNNTPFCLLALSIDSKDCNGEALAVLVGLLNERLRITDDKGYLEDGRIGVILPDTPDSGAQVVARDVCNKYRAAGGSIDCEIFVYPADFDIDGNPLFEEEELDADIPANHEAPARSMQAMFSKRPPLWKRAIDIAGASFLAVALSPVLLAAAIIVKLSSPGPVLFVQQRAGLGGKPFRMFKFRTMRVGADAEKAELRQLSEQDGPAFKLTEDPRVTRLGQLLRTTSIDELPQLLNVLKGDMSLVGPRPLPLEESDECEPWQRRRLDIAPGITCIWQVAGRSNVSFAEWVRMDIEYVKLMSPWQDFKLLLLTVPSVLLCKGAK